MTSELQRIAQGLIECLEQVPQIAAKVHRTAALLRDDAAYVVAVTPADPESRALALQLDDSARACETAVDQASKALPEAIDWVESKIRESGHNAEGTSRGHERAPSPSATEAPDDDHHRPDAPAEPPPPPEPGRKRHPLQDQIATTDNPGRSTDDVLRSFRTLPGGRQKSVKTVSSETELRQTFDDWVAGAERLPPRGPKIPEVYRLPDGGEVQWRTASGSGGAAIDIIPGNGPRRKVHVK